jgi:hypothetical protein
MTAIEATVPHSKTRKQPARKAELAASTAAPATATIAQADTIPYDDAVSEGKEIVANEKRGQMRLGELADKLEPKYKDRTLAKFAKEIGIAPCTLERYRSVYRAWKENLAPGPVSYAVLRALQDHPDRLNIVKENPGLTQAQARNMRGDPGKAEQTDWHKHNTKWFRELCNIAGNAIRVAETTHHCTTQEQWCRLLEAVEPRMLSQVRKGGKALVALVDRLEAQLEAQELAEPEEVAA